MNSSLFAQTINNGNAIPISDIPVIDYSVFYNEIDILLNDPFFHCLNYYAVKFDDNLRFFCCIADDASGVIRIYSHVLMLNSKKEIDSLTQKHISMHVFEREITENFGIKFINNPWEKPLRYTYNKSDSKQIISNYPFYSISGDELHEVGVGPVHAGIIEPGHFRFICSGEKVLHLEIQLGYQHRGIEQLIKQSSNLLRSQILAESIAGDTAIGHGLAYAQLIETLADISVSKVLQAERIIALEMERIAVHIGDSAALFNDVAYQLGQVVNEALRTTIINSILLWCGNRFGKSLIRTGGTHYPLTNLIANNIMNNVSETVEKFNFMAERSIHMPGILLRFDNVGTISNKQAILIGAVGMTARMTGLPRDARASHPFQYFRSLIFSTDIQNTGDILARFNLRVAEVNSSFMLINSCMEYLNSTKWNEKQQFPVNNVNLKPSAFAISVTEGWRGEIVHSAITDKSGNIYHYKIKDPSLHNWLALALAVREQEISDFPVCNKSFNLSYCGHDL